MGCNDYNGIESTTRLRDLASSAVCTATRSKLISIPIALHNPAIRLRAKREITSPLLLLRPTRAGTMWYRAPLRTPSVARRVAPGKKIATPDVLCVRRLVCLFAYGGFRWTVLAAHNKRSGDTRGSVSIVCNAKWEIKTVCSLVYAAPLRKTVARKEQLQEVQKAWLTLGGACAVVLEAGYTTPAMTAHDIHRVSILYKSTLYEL